MDQAAGDRRARARGRAAGDALEIPDIAAARQVGVEAVGAHGELDHGEAAEVDGAGPVQAFEHGRRRGRAEFAPDTGAAA